MILDRHIFGSNFHEIHTSNVGVENVHIMNLRLPQQQDIAS